MTTKRGPARIAAGAWALACVAACALGPVAATAATAGMPSLDPPVLQLPRGLADKQVRLPEDDGRTVLVRMRGGAALDAVARTHRARPGAAIPGTGFRRVTVPADRLHRTLHALRRDPRVAQAALNRRRSIEAEPNDPWAVKSGGQNWRQTVRLPAAWDVTQGSTAVTVAILDTGVDLDHRDLASRIVAGRDVVHGDARADDANGHGTFVAGLAAAATDNGIGVAGAAWTASIMPVQVLDDRGSGWDDDIATGITWAADHGADVINLSLSGPGASPVLEAAVDYARAQGAVVVAAAGNDLTDDPAYPAAIPGVVAVTATDWSGQFAWFSNWGDHVDVAAPGMDVVGLQVAEGPRETYDRAHGTSFSAPIVAGAAVLVLAQHPSWTPDQVAARLRDTARDAGPLGTDPYYGAGVLDAAAATGAAAPPPPTRPARADEPFEPNDTPDRTTPAGALPATFEARFAPEGDVDWYSVDVTFTGWMVVGAGKRSAFNGDRTEETDVAIELYGPNLEKLAEADGQGPAGYNELLSHYVRTPGRYYIRARNALGSQGTYGISVAQADDPDGIDPRMTEGSNYPTGSRADTVTTGDVNGDGRRDVLLTTEMTGNDPRNYQLFLFEQDADGWLHAPRIVEVDGMARSVTTGDIDGDGRTDAVVPTGFGVEILHQRSGTLVDDEFVFTGSAIDADVADLDGDGDRDLVTSGLGRVQRALQTPTGWNVEAVATLHTDEVEVADVTGDGRPDVVAMTPVGVFVVAQTAGGGWAGPVRHQDPRLGCWCLAGIDVAELTGDGRLDIAVTQHGSTQGDWMFVIPQTPTGTMGDLRPGLDAGRHPQPVETGDFDGDGRADLVTANGGWYEWNVLRQTGPGTFARASHHWIPYATHYDVNGLAVGDVTGDGRPDVAIADYNHGLVVSRNVDGTGPSAANGVWVRWASPADGSQGSGGTVTPTIRFGRALDATTVTAANVELTTASGAPVAATASYDAATRTATLRPAAQLASGGYVLAVSGVRSATGATMPGIHRTRFRVGTLSDTSPPDTVIDALSARLLQNDPLRSRFHATEAGATFECAVDTQPFEPCESAEWWENVGPLGTHTLRVRATDTSGNVDPTPAERSFVVYDYFDYAPTDFLPQATVVTGESGTSSAVNRTAGKDEFEMDHAGNPGGASVWWRWTAPRRGPVTFETTGSDFDTLLGVSIGPTDLPRAQFQDVVGANDDAGPGAVTSRVTFVAEAGQEYNIAVDGFNTLWFNAATGNVSLRWAMAPPPADTTPPETTILEAPPALTRESARFRFTSATDGDATFECRRGIAGQYAEWRRCFSGYDVPGFDGDWLFEVRAVDAAGNRDPTPATHRWTVDGRWPAVETLSGTSGTTASTSASFSWTLDEPGAGSQCSVDWGPWHPCTSPRSYSELGEGFHQFAVRGVDAAGNVGELERITWTVDPAPPVLDTQLTVGPPDQTNDRHARFEFTASRTTAEFECKLDSRPWASCYTPTYLWYEDLPEGTHTFSVRAVDGTERDPTPASRTWTVGTPPALDTSITDGPSEVVASRSASFTFTANRPGATFECRLDGGPFATCTSPKAYTSLADGSHTFDVRAVDGGVSDPTPASRTWTIDATPPAVEITDGPSGTVAARDATFGFTGEDGATFECRLDGGAYVGCSSPFSYTSLDDGPHTFEVRARDAYGNTATAARTWAIDTTPPETSITAGPSGTVGSGSASFTFTSEPGAAFECRLDFGAWAACASPKEYTSLAEGGHTFEVRAGDGVGNWDASPASRSWTVQTTVPDVTPPETSIADGPSGRTRATTATFSFSSNEPGSSFSCRLDGASWTSCASPVDYSGLADGEHTFLVRAADDAGNVDASPASRTWHVDTRAPVASIDGGPEGEVTDTSPTFTFSADEAGVTMLCRLDDQPWAPCASPYELPALPAGPHVFAVTAVDAAGNEDTSPATQGFTILEPNEEEPEEPTPPTPPDPGDAGDEPPPDLIETVAGSGDAVPDEGLAAPGPPAPGSSPLGPPLIGDVRLDRRRLRVRGRGASLIRTGGLQVTFRFTGPEPALVGVRVLRGSTPLRGGFGVVAVSGTNRFRFSGRLASRALKPGTYRLRLIATGRAGAISSALSPAFRIAR